MRLRLATPADAQLLRLWDSKPHVAAAGGEPEENHIDWEAELPRCVAWREFLIAEEAGRSIGFLQIIDPREEESHYWGACEPNLRAIDIWIGEEADLGRGYGTAMMQQALARCFASPEVVAVLIDPLADNVRAHRFYARFGFRFQEARRFLDCDDCLVFRLDRADWRKGD